MHAKLLSNAKPTARGITNPSATSDAWVLLCRFLDEAMTQILDESIGSWP